MEKKVEGLLGVSMEKIREMADANAVIGDPITTPDGTMLIPVSKVSYGFAGGGSDLPNKANADLFGGGSGAGINITPVAFLVIADGDVRLLHVVSKPDATDKIVNLVPDLVDKVSGLFTKKKDKETAETTVESAEGTVTKTETVTTVKTEESR